MWFVPAMQAWTANSTWPVERKARLLQNVEASLFCCIHALICRPQQSFLVGAIQGVGGHANVYPQGTASDADFLDGPGVVLGSMKGLFFCGIRLESAVVEAPRQAAPLHDIGKIAIPDAILRKASQLTPEEYGFMKSHTVVGASLLEGGKSVYLQMASRIARSHHEHFDGGGYPDGLKGEAIPLEARIVAVVDVFDALVCRRPYKQAWPVPQAVAAIKRQAGFQFDPDVVRVFLQCAHEGAFLLPAPLAQS